MHTNHNILIFSHLKSIACFFIAGNGGGYLGLFLGCALTQLPDLLNVFIRKMKDIVKQTGIMTNIQESGNLGEQ